MNRFSISWLLRIVDPNCVADEVIFAEVDQILEQLLSIERGAGDVYDSTTSVDLVCGTLEVSVDVCADSVEAAQQKSLHLIQAAMEARRGAVTFLMPQLVSLT